MGRWIRNHDVHQIHSADWNEVEESVQQNHEQGAPYLSILLSDFSILTVKSVNNSGDDNRNPVFQGWKSEIPEEQRKDLGFEHIGLTVRHALSVGNDRWIIYYGTTCHMCHNKQELRRHPSDKALDVTLGNGQHL